MQRDNLVTNDRWVYGYNIDDDDDDDIDDDDDVDDDDVDLTNTYFCSKLLIFVLLCRQLACARIQSKEGVTMISFTISIL